MNSFENDNPTATRTFINACSASCQNLLRKMDAAKQMLLSEFRQVVRGHEEMVALALTEAEALAEQTDFPFLVYPTLAREKVEAVAAWNHRQQAVLRRTGHLSFAA